MWFPVRCIWTISPYLTAKVLLFFLFSKKMDKKSDFLAQKTCKSGEKYVILQRF